MKLVKIVLVCLIVFVLLCTGITWFLGPDSLRFCGERPNGEGNCKQVDAIVVVSGGDTNARADEGIKLYKNGWAKYIIFSGAAADKSGPSNAWAMERRAIDAGVSGEAVLLDEQSATTDTNAINTTDIARKAGMQSLIVVSSGYHMRRVLMEFQRNGAHLTIMAHPVPEDKDWSRFWWTTPWGWSLAVSELIKDAVTATGGIDRS